MPVFRNRTSGQIVWLEADPSYLDGLARWERIEDLQSPQSVAAAPTVVFTDTESAPVDEIDEPARPADAADRKEWLAYAKANGYTNAQLKGVKTADIRGWFE